MNGIAFENGEKVAVVDFDFDAVEDADRGNPLTAELERPVWEYILSEPRAAELLSKMRRVVCKIALMSNSKMGAETFLIATGDAAADGKTITGTAKRHGLTKAAVSSACVSWCEFLGKRPSEYMRGEASKITFKKSNINKKRK